MLGGDFLARSKRLKEQQAKEAIVAKSRREREIRAKARHQEAQERIEKDLLAKREEEQKKKEQEQAYQDAIAEHNQGLFWSSTLNARPLDEATLHTRRVRRYVDKISLPHDVGEYLFHHGAVEKNGPMFFEITRHRKGDIIRGREGREEGDKGEVIRTTHAGLLDFTAPPGTVRLGSKILRALDLLKPSEEEKEKEIELGRRNHRNHDKDDMDVDVDVEDNRHQNHRKDRDVSGAANSSPFFPPQAAQQQQQQEQQQEEEEDKQEHPQIIDPHQSSSSTLSSSLVRPPRVPFEDISLGSVQITYVRLPKGKSCQFQPLLSSWSNDTRDVDLKDVLEEVMMTCSVITEGDLIPVPTLGASKDHATAHDGHRPPSSTVHLLRVCQVEAIEEKKNQQGDDNNDDNNDNNDNNDDDDKRNTSILSRTEDAAAYPPSDRRAVTVVETDLEVDIMLPAEDEMERLNALYDTTDTTTVDGGGQEDLPDTTTKRNGSEGAVHPVAARRRGLPPHLHKAQSAFGTRITSSPHVVGEEEEEEEERRNKKNGVPPTPSTLQEKDKAEMEEEAMVVMEKHRQWMQARANSLPPEPNEGAEGVVQIRLRLPDGRSVNRRFLSHADQTLTLFHWVDSVNPVPGKYRLTANFPRRVIDRAISVGQSLLEAGLSHPQEALFLEHISNT